MKMTCILLAMIFGSCAVAAEHDFTAVAIRLGPDAGPIEHRVAALLAERLQEPAGLPVRIETETGAIPGGENELLVLLGIPAHHAEIRAVFYDHRIPVLTELAPGPEGFLLRGFFEADRPFVLAAGIDARGTLYAVGEFLRQATITETGVKLPAKIEVRTAPAFMVRGTQFGQSHIAKNLAKVRDWTEAETQRVILDYALAGANVFSDDGDYYEFLKSFDLMAQGGFGANTGSGPPEWEAKESIGRTGYVCLSVPETVAAQLKRFEEFARKSPPFDFLKFHGGDGGGCECDACKPYGLTFIKVVEQMAAIWHRYHPDTKIYFTNQKFENDDDLAIFAYLQEKKRDWLWAWGYGPGSDAMSWQPGHRQTHRMDLFRYPGFGPFSRYNHEILHQLPPNQVLVYYNEITHWRYAQHGYIQMYPRTDRDGHHPPHWNHFVYERRPDQALTMVYDRLTFYAWPRFYHWLFGEVVRYGVGDITHSSGHHDHFNQWMWQRLLWKPMQTVEDVVLEYARTWFGPEAADVMAKAIFQLEENLEENPAIPITQKEGIDRYYDLVAAAGEKMPDIHRKSNWLWREYMQKGALDLYTKHAVIGQKTLEDRIVARTVEALENGVLDDAIAEMMPWFDTPRETPLMAQLREETGRLGEESNALFGVRNEGYFNLDHDFIGLGWLKRQLERAREAIGEEQIELLRMIVAYEDPGEGGFYDNLGTSNPAPNVVFGYPYDHGQPYVHPMLDEGNRPSQRSMHYTQDEAQGVTLEYRNLDPDAQYRIRFTFVRPWFQERYAFRMNQKRQSIYADDHLLAKDIELPLQMSDFFTYDIPAEATKDGNLIVRLEKDPEVASGDRVTVEQWRNSGGWGTLVSEVWLMKRK